MRHCTERSSLRGRPKRKPRSPGIKSRTWSGASFRVSARWARPWSSTVDGFGGTGIEVNGTGAYIVFRNDVLIETPGGIGIFVFGAVGFGFGPVTGAVIQSNNVVMQPVGDIDGSLFNDTIDLAGLVSD